MKADSRFCRIFSLIMVLLLDVADLASDWLFYVDVSIAEQGLVYGLPDQGAVIGLLLFSIVGTFTYTFEVANLFRQVCTGKAWLNVDLVGAVIMWIEDMPQIIINVYIATCREDPISLFQITKATVIIFSIIIRIIMSLIKYCRDKEDGKTTASRLHVTYRVFIMLGLFLTFAGACAVFVFTQTQRDLDGNVIFEVPETIFEDRYNDDRYFKNVSIFFHHPTFDVNEPANVSEANWMRLITINSVRNLPEKVVMFSYEYQNTSTEVRMVLWENDGDVWEAAECYTLKKTDMSMTKETDCANFISPSSERTSITFKFSFTPPDRVFRKLVFGDIKFNAKYNDHNGFCEDISADNITDNIEAGLEDSIDITVHYYRSWVGEDNHVVVRPGGSRFYREGDLVDITEVWATGWYNCETKGSLAPHVDRAVETPCDAN